MTDEQLVQHLHLAAGELNRRLKEGNGICRASVQQDEPGPLDPPAGLCDALFATIAAAQAALIANNCPGV